MSSHPISNFTSVTLLATKPINPFSHYFTLPSLHACMGPIPITWMRGGGAFRRGHQWVSLWYSGEVRYACCLESSYGINQTHICREVRDEWCMQSVEALQWWNLSALLGSHPSLWKVLRRLTQSLKLDLFHPQKEEYQQWIMGTTSLWLGRWPPMFDMESRLTQMYTDATFGHCHHAIRDILTPVLLALYESRRKSKSK